MAAERVFPRAETRVRIAGHGASVMMIPSLFVSRFFFFLLLFGVSVGIGGLGASHPSFFLPR